MEDCTSALEQIQDPSKPMEACEATGRSLIRLLVRRASAFMELQLYSRTAADYREVRECPVLLGSALERAGEHLLKC